MTSLKRAAVAGATILASLVGTAGTASAATAGSVILVSVVDEAPTEAVDLADDETPTDPGSGSWGGASVPMGDRVVRDGSRGTRSPGVPPPDREVFVRHMDESASERVSVNNEGDAAKGRAMRLS